MTVIGSRRPAHIALHDAGICDAHCVIVNTGKDVLLKDLHTPGGTCCKTSRVDLTVLKDGDVITVGETTVQVAINHPKEPSSAQSRWSQTAEDPEGTQVPWKPAGTW